MAKKGYKVCWWFPLRKATCRVLSSKQHRSSREAAETVLMQNPNAFVRVTSPRGGGRGVIYKQTGGRIRIWKGAYI